MQTREEIIEGNKLIAKFMDGELETNLPYTYTKMGWINTPANNNKHIAQDYDLKYHSSWDWLMPVLIKIVSLEEYHESPVGDLPYMEGNPLAVFSTKQKWDENFDKESIWEHCVEFIKWYNQIHKEITANNSQQENYYK